ncbi:uncharacterized protein LOC62_04G006372 [Vanrija pseudolonga]|uniref:Uncharacterized protein n=1 Tax=Vanrija pseudolonga TaxID=143232 RepID=A0AAF1BM09_9TREE|nr:hypothetical protein LOC62_04G006372 [Vanrija pseudolonga]
MPMITRDEPRRVLYPRFFVASAKMIGNMIDLEHDEHDHCDAGGAVQRRDEDPDDRGDEGINAEQDGGSDDSEQHDAEETADGEQDERVREQLGAAVVLEPGVRAALLRVVGDEIRLLDLGELGEEEQQGDDDADDRDGKIHPLDKYFAAMNGPANCATPLNACESCRRKLDTDTGGMTEMYELAATSSDASPLAMTPVHTTNPPNTASLLLLLMENLAHGQNMIAPSAYRLRPMMIVNLYPLRFITSPATGEKQK